MTTLSAALALTIVVTALVADVGAQYDGSGYPAGDDDDDYPCDDDDYPCDLQEQTYLGGDPPLPKGIGEICGAYSECQDHLCCLQSYDGRTTCQPKSEPGHWCSDEQVKGGVHINLCPCLQGTCKENICSL
uniref:Putative tick ixodegrin n=1 Tax=Ixodes ricinus TaxID=34613 RepID=V5H890_IXORI